jgi:peptide/nickel transport system ATP-binding protein
MAVHANIADRVGIMYAGRIVEDAKVDDIFERPIHPYTKHLIQSLPMIGDKTYRESIPGAPPNLANPPEGCRFHPRCPYVMDVCTQEVPPLVQVKNREERHRVACFLTEKEGRHE